MAPDPNNPVQNQYKVLRIYEGGTDQKDDWHKIDNPYGEGDIAKIKDPAGGSDRNEITSIPSPFGRIHLVETAFRIINHQARENPSALSGDTIYHKLVSDSLDVGEILFKYDLLRNQFNLSLVKWNKQADLETLIRSPLESHKLLGETLKIFLDQDGPSSNFHLAENLFFLSLQHVIIGGTSPSTLFFPSGNDLVFARITQGDYSFFDHKYDPLYKRDPDYQKYLHTLFKVYPQLGVQMPLFYNYLLVNLRALQSFNPTLEVNIQQMKNDPTYNLERFLRDPAYARWENTQSIEIFPGVEHLKKSTVISPEMVGDFIIDSRKFQGHPKPVALQRGFARRLRYFGREWSSDIPVPFFDDREINRRTAPGQHIQYPYLTVSDFLEPYLIEVPFSLDQEHFFDGNPKGVFLGDKSTKEPPDNMYLIPIRDEYFKYFDLEDLTRGKTERGEPIFKMEKVEDSAPNGGGVKVVVTLNIPISSSGEYVQFTREYRENGRVDLASNTGEIVVLNLNLAMFPFVGKTSADLHKIVGFIDADVENGRESEYNVRFLDINASGSYPVSPRSSTYRSDQSKKHLHNGTTRYFVMENHFQAVEVSKPNGIKGLIVPLFPRHNESGDNKQFTFAVDFGTTTTHIEYSVEGETPQPLEITETDTQLVTLNHPYWGVKLLPVLESLLTRELLPYYIGASYKYKLPFRTSIAEIDGLNHLRPNFSFGDLNIPFHYEKSKALNSEVITTNLKWAKLSGPEQATNSNRVEKFIECLLIIMRNKVAQNLGDLGRTRVIWFYPTSMSSNQITGLQKIWHSKYAKYFGANDNLVDFSESEAPFYYFNENDALSEQFPVINIDIGGGTTDVVVFKNRTPQFLTSFKFAGNAVFGDGYRTDTSADNGFVRKFKPMVFKFLDQNKQLLNELMGLYEQFNRTGKASSADMMAFFFSLENNKDILDNGLEPKISRDIASHDEFNIVFILFFGAILYHIARIMNKKGYDMPRNICLSGNGSKIINLLDESPRLSGVEKLARLIFEKVYGEKYHSQGLSFLQGENPKVATCKGGIKKFNQNNARVDFDRIVMIGDHHNTLLVNGMVSAGSPIPNLKYKDIRENSELKNSVIREVEAFTDLLFNLDSEINFSDLFGIAPGKITQYRQDLTRDLMAFLEQGINERMGISDPEQNVEDSLFFYPLIGALYRLTQKIAGPNS